jgi:hypothetical protein
MKILKDSVWIPRNEDMTFRVMFICAALVISPAACLCAAGSAGEVLELIRNLVEEREGVSQQESRPLVAEILGLVSSDPFLKARVLSRPGRIETTEAIMWAAAKKSGFDERTFRHSFPALSKFGTVFVISKSYFGTPRIIYQTHADRMYDDLHMLYGFGDLPVTAPFVKVGSWKDPYKITGWIGDFTFRNTALGPYLVSICEGRQTTGASSTRHILYWVRIEAFRLVPERFEAYDVPISCQRQPSDLKAIARPGPHM